MPAQSRKGLFNTGQRCLWQNNAQKPQGFFAYAVFFPLIQCTSFIPEARAVLDLVDQCSREIPKGKFQVIAIEGLDATGK